MKWLVFIALVGLSIPGSFLSGLLALSIMGFTINIVVLFALILSVGLLVDGAIVVVEYADRKLKEGLSIIDAYAEASKKMALPIISSTATTLAAQDSAAKHDDTCLNLLSKIDGEDRQLICTRIRIGSSWSTIGRGTERLDVPDPRCWPVAAAG